MKLWEIASRTSFSISKLTELVESAKSASRNAYAPYSSYKVGAAIITNSGRIVGGCNVENASYGLSICAERAALVRAISDGFDEPFSMIAVYAPNEGDKRRGTAPCGACRQCLIEFNPNMMIILIPSLGDDYAMWTITDLLPAHFGPQSLK